MSEELTDAQVAAIMAAILKITGAGSLLELGSRETAVTKEQWREAYEIAGVPWTDYNENWQTH
jgi:hypothetical protein